MKRRRRGAGVAFMGPPSRPPGLPIARGTVTVPLGTIALEREAGRVAVARQLMEAIIDAAAGDDFLFLSDIEDAFDNVLNWRDEERYLHGPEPDRKEEDPDASDVT